MNESMLIPSAHLQHIALQKTRNKIKAHKKRNGMKGRTKSRQHERKEDRK